MRISLFLIGCLCGALPPAARASDRTAFEPGQVFHLDAAVPAPRMDMPDVFQAAGRGSIVRAQGGNPSTFETPPISPPGIDPNAPYAAPYSPTPYPGGELRDPFLYGDPVLGAPQGSTILSGVNGPQPYRFGYTPRFDYTFLAPAGTQAPGNGKFTSNEFNFELANVKPVGPGWVFTSTPQIGARLWEGPGSPDLPPAVYRLGWDLTLAAPIVGLWSMQLDFNPSINTDFGGALANESLNLDANAMLFYRSSPQLMLVLGVGYWDRVENFILPYAGVVWNPTDRWEIRALFPKSRVSYFLGNFGQASHWLYGSGEFHVESYQINQPGVGSNQQVQFQDWRVAIGLRSDHYTYDKFIELGYVFGRNVDFARATPSFDINDALMLRIGVKF